MRKQKKLIEQNERLNAKDENGNPAKHAMLLANTKVKHKSAIRYEPAVKDKGFRPFYMTVKQITIPLFIKKNRRGQEVWGTKLLGYATVPILKNGEGIKRPVPCYRDGTPRFEVKENES